MNKDILLRSISIYGSKMVMNGKRAKTSTAKRPLKYKIASVLMFLSTF